MPAKDRQKENADIAGRLVKVRHHFRLSQTEVAEQLGIERERYRAYESGRVAIPASVALRFCRNFIVSEHWLATGRVGGYQTSTDPRFRDVEDVDEPLFGPSKTRLCMSLELDPRAILPSPRATFAESWESLHPLWVNVAGLLFRSPRILSAPDDPPHFLRNASIFLMEYFGERLRGPRLTGYFKELFHIGAEMSWEASRIEVEALKNGFDNEVDVRDRLTSVMLADLPVDWPELRERLTDQLSERGSKSALAKEFGVTRQTVHSWLQGDAAPSADIVLRLIPWVLKAEKKKSPTAQ